MLVDSSGFAHRAFHSAIPRFRDSDGLPTSAILGFMSLLWRMIGAAEADRPTLAAAIFDGPGKNFRHRLFPAYKANRGERSEELTVQFPYLLHVAETLGLTPITAKGWEADDIIATLAKRAAKAGIRTTIVSVDKDFNQLVKDGVVEIVIPGQSRMLEADVLKKFGVTPGQFVDFQALRGDDVDNIPGVPGCGDEKAAALIRRYGDLEGVLGHADEIRFPDIRARLKREKYRADARLSYKLAKLRTDVPLKIDLASLTMPRPMISHLKELLKAFEAPLQLSAIFNLDPQLARPVERLENPFLWWAEEIIAPGQKMPDLPQCGYYQRRLVKDGVLCPACIWREEQLDIETAEPTGLEVLLCEVNGQRKDPFSEWARLAMHPITAPEYEFQVKDFGHARRYRKDDPKATPNKPIKLSEFPVSRNPKRKTVR